MLTNPFRVPLAREHLRIRLVMNAGVNPMSGYWLGDDPANYADETAEECAGRLDYMQRLNQAVGHIAGLIEGCQIRVWRDRNGSFELAPPVSTAQTFYAQDGEMDDLYFERSEWEMLFEQNYPKTDLAHWAFGADALSSIVERPTQEASLAVSPNAKIGRPLGSGSFKSEDEQLFTKIDMLLSGKEVKSATGAAWHLVKNIPGSGSPENRVKRLVRGYMDRNRKGS